MTYGKIIGGGLPVGLVTCTDKVAFNSFNNPDKKIHTGGTFSGNPLVSETGTAVISELVKLDYSLINDFGELLRNRLNLFFKESSLPFSAIGTGSINRLAFTDKKFRNRSERDRLEMSYEIQTQFQLNMLKQKVAWPTNGILFTGFCNNKEQIEDFCTKIGFAAKNIIENNTKF